jgi:mono/diheme cytochrome c family protein
MRRRALRFTAFALICAGLESPALRGTALTEAPTAAAQANYILNCMGCHTADGSGAVGKVPSLRDSLMPLASSAAGRRYLVEVPGAAQSVLSNLELAQVLSWMVRNLSARAVPPEFVDFTESEVAGYRRTPLIDVRAERARLLGSSLDRSGND